MAAPGAPAPDAAAFAGLSPEQAAALRAVVAEYGARPEVAAILLAGSVVRGEGGPTSDLDCWVMADLPYRQRRSFLVDGVPVEVFLNPPAALDRALLTADAHAMHMVGYGRPVYVRPGAAAEVAAWQARSRAAYTAGPPPLDAEAVARERYAAIDLLLDAADVAGTDPAAARLVMDQALAAVLALRYARRRVWMPKWKRLPADLAARDPALAARVRAYLAAPDAAAAYAALEAVYAAVLPEGFGLVQWCWESGRDPIAE